MSYNEYVKARLPRGFVDRNYAELEATEYMLAVIRKTYELYGFDVLETPFFEFSDALGKFLPDQDRPNAGVFSFQDDDAQWMSLRYDLTAPLARYFSENYETLPKPFRSFRSGWVFRNEKPGPGRFRQFMQCDADTVGTSSVAADAEMCMMASDTLERVGIARRDHIVKVNNRKILDGVLEIIGVSTAGNEIQRLTVLRAIDKLDRLGVDGVRLLLGNGRKDESGDFTKGAGLDEASIKRVLDFVSSLGSSNTDTLNNLLKVVSGSVRGEEGVQELQTMNALFEASGYGDGRIAFDPSVVRGLEYYTGPVYEAELTFSVEDENGHPVRFGSVAGGGRYDGLVNRFRAESSPATGFSIGISRLIAALRHIQSPVVSLSKALGPVLILVMDRDQIAHYQSLTDQLRRAGIRAELYLGTSGMKAQMKYADRRNSPCVIIQGSDEREKNEVQIKDLFEGAKVSETITDNAEWKASRPAQFSVPQEKMVESVFSVLERYS